MRAVATRAGCTAAAIYRHVASKEALVTLVVEESLHEYEQTLWREIASLPVGSFTRLATLGEAYIRFASERRSHFRVLFDPAVPRPRPIEDFPGRAGFDILRQCVVEAMEAGELRRADPDLIALLLWTRVHGIATLLLACDVGSINPKLRRRGAPLALFRDTRDFVLFGIRGSQ